MSPDGESSDGATGLTMVVSVAFGPDGMLYVTQIITGLDFVGPDQPPSIKPGNIVRVLPNGAQEVVADGLNLPNGIAFDRAGNLYVVVNSTFPPDTPPPATPEGQVLRCDGVAAPTRPPLRPPVQVPARAGLDPDRD